MGEGLCVMSSGTQVPASHDVASSLLGTQTVEGDIWANDAGSGSKRNRSPEGTTLTHVVTQLPPKYIRLGNAVPGCREEEQNPGVPGAEPGSSGPATPPASFTVCVPGPPCSADRPSLRSCSLLSDEKALDTRGLAPCSPATLLEGLHPGPSPER